MTTQSTTTIPGQNPTVNRAPVFVSYRHVDGTDAMLDIRRLLHTAGIPTWIDQDALFAGNLDGNIANIADAGASGAVLVLTKSVAEPGNYVLTRELPAFCELARNGFFIAIVNCVTLADGSLDEAAPERMLAGFWDVLAPQMRYTIATDADQKNLVYGLLGHRCQVPGGEVRVGIQSRVHSQGGNPDACDLDFRLETDELDVVQPEDLAAWALGTHLASNRAAAVNPSHVRLSGGAQPGLAAALGADFNHMRFPSMTIYQGSASGDQWPCVSVASTDHTLVRKPEGASPGHGDIAVLVRPQASSTDPSFDALVASLPVCASYLLEVTPGTLLDPTEGEWLATQVRAQLEELTTHHEGRVHLCIKGAFPMAVQIGRWLNTFETVLYDLAKDSSDPQLTRRRYVPVAVAESNGSGGRQPVRPVKPGDLWPEADSTPLTLVNHTPHDVTLYRNGKPVITWPAVKPMARMQENIQQGSVRRFSNGTDEVETPIDRVSYGAPENLPPAREGVGYIVSRVLAEKVRRPDLFFPSREERDEKGNIIGCRALGQFLARIG